MRRDSEGHLHKVVMFKGVEGYVVRWTENCSGCTNYVDGHLDNGPHGCSECGFTGRSRREHWVPFDMGAAQAAGVL